VEKAVPSINQSFRGREPKRVERTAAHELSLSHIISDYINYYASADTHTARAKRYDLNHFLLFIAQSCGTKVEELLLTDWTYQQTQNFVEYRLQLGEAPATVSRRLATVKHLGRTLAERFPGFVNPAREVKSPSSPIQKPKGLSTEDVTLLRQAAMELEDQTREEFTGLRNRFLIEMLLNTGLRADEVRLLVVGQVTPDRQWIKNVRTKGKKFRDVYIDTKLRTLLEVYLAQREDQLLIKIPGYLGLTPAERDRIPLLVSFREINVLKPSTFGLAPKTIWRIVSETGLRASILAGEPMESLHPHKLRHTFAHGLLESSNDIRLVAQALGHSDVRTTMRYTERVNEEMAEAIERMVNKNQQGKR
jgi:site-specific recombinase XerD